MRTIIQGNLRRFVLLLACVLLLGIPFSAPLAAQDASSAEGVSVETSEQVFATLCALDAAGFNADESTLGDMPERLALREQLLSLHGPATEAVRKFYREHILADPGALLSEYVTFALALGPAPRFSFNMSEDALPPEAVALEDFQPLLAAFYKEADLGPRWQKIEPEYEPLAASYRTVLRGVVVKTNAYLREVVRTNGGRSFTVYVEPLAGARTNFRNLGDHYAVVAGAHQADSTSEIQHAYLHFMLDPMVLQLQDDIQAKRALLDIAAHAPELPDQYRADFVSFVDECMIKAVELRLRHLPAAKQEAVLAEDDASGFILVRPLVDGLLKFEKDVPSMTYYFPQLVDGINVEAERQRLQQVQFANGAPAAAEAPSSVSAPAPPPSTDPDQLLAQGDRAIVLHDATAAASAFNQVLQLDPENIHALYGLAVATVLSGHADESKALFQRVVKRSADAMQAPGAGVQAVDPSVLAWSHIYIGRIDDLEDTRDSAVKEYMAALAVVGAPDSARVAAQHGVDSAYAPASRAGAPPAPRP